MKESMLFKEDFNTNISNMNINNSKLSSEFKSILTRISPKLNTEVVFLLKYKHPINLKHPKILDEKIQWLKLNSYLGNKLVTKCADKFEVRKYVKSCGCERILNKLYFACDSVDEINWDQLPNKFVIKWNFGSGENLIVPDKRKLNINWAIKQLKKWQKEAKTFYLPYSEMQYKGIKPKIICEKFIDTEDGNLPVDYKLFCFNGKPDSVMLCAERETGHPKFYFFSRDWKLLKYNRLGASMPDDFTLPKPNGIDKVFEYAEKLSKPFPFVRADFYLENGEVIFGELTFTPCGGYDLNFLPATREELGNKIDLGYKPNNKKQQVRK